MNSNRIAGVKNFVDHTAVKNNIANITNNDIRQIDFLFDYNLLDIDNLEKEKLKKHEKNLLFHRKQINKATVDMGRAFTEAREVFIKSHSESFVNWYEQLGFNKDQVSVAMNRYQLTVEYPNAKDNIINLSDVAIKEVTNKKTPDYIKEKVISGEIVTGQQIKKERENNSRALEKFPQEEKNNSKALEKFPEIEEAEIVPKTISYEKIEKVIRDLEKRITDIEVNSLEGNSEDIYEKLKKALEVLR